MSAMPEGSVDLVLADLPFGITDLYWDKRLDMAALWAGYRRVLREAGAILLFATQPFATDLINAARAASSRIGFRYEWIWEKPCPTGFLNAHRMPLRRHENVLVFYRRLPWYRPPGLRAREKRKAGGWRSAVWRGCYQRAWTTRLTGWPQSIVRRGASEFVGRAAAEKPVDLLRFFIETYTRPGDVVLDNTMGLGSTGQAAVECGRRFIGMELDPERFASARRRIRRALRVAVGSGAWAAHGPVGAPARLLVENRASTPARIVAAKKSIGQQWGFDECLRDRPVNGAFTDRAQPLKKFGKKRSLINRPAA